MKFSTFQHFAMMFKHDIYGCEVSFAVELPLYLKPSFKKKVETNTSIFLTSARSRNVLLVMSWLSSRCRWGRWQRMQVEQLHSKPTGLAVYSGDFRPNHFNVFTRPKFVKSYNKTYMCLTLVDQCGSLSIFTCSNCSKQMTIRIT